jgi:hypothetical protein
VPKANCSVGGCESESFSRGLCTRHYQRWRKYGHPPAAPVPVPERHQFCTVEGCGRPRKGRGLCEPHLVRLRKTGDVQADIPIAGRNVPLAERLLARADLETLPGCWLFCGSLTAEGYGYTVTGSRRDGSRRTVTVHRLAYEEWIGPIPEGAQIDHTCHSNDPTCLAGVACLHRRCFNPAHLEAVTPLVNAQRSHKAEIERQRAAERTRCQRGHEYTEANTRWYNGHRWCRACDRERAQAKRDRLKTEAAQAPQQSASGDALRPGD